MAPPSNHKDDIPDSSSELTYQNDIPSHSTGFNIELDKLRSHIPDTRATMPRSMDYSYDPRYDGINNAPPSGFSKSLRHGKKVWATACCGSCCGLAAWIIGSLLIATAFVVLLVKVLHNPAAPSAAISSTAASLIEEKTITVTQSTMSIPISTTTASSISTDTTTFTSVSILTTVSVTTETYTPPSTIITTVTSEGETTTLTSVATSVVTTSQMPMPTSVTTETETSVTVSIALSTAVSSSLSTEKTTDTSTVMTTTTAEGSRHHSDADNDDNTDEGSGRTTTLTESSINFSPLVEPSSTTDPQITPSTSLSTSSNNLETLISANKTPAPTRTHPRAMTHSTLSTARPNPMLQPEDPHKSTGIPVPGASTVPWPTSTGITLHYSGSFHTKRTAVQATSEADNDSNHHVKTELLDGSTWPATVDMAGINKQLSSVEALMSSGSTNPGYVTLMSEALTAMQAEQSTIESWCSDHMSARQTNTLVRSYCGYRETPITRRAVESETASTPYNQDTTLITETVSTTQTIMLTKTSFLDQTFPSDSTASSFLSATDSQEISNNTILISRDVKMSDWGVTNAKTPPKVGTFVLHLPPHRWDCVRKPGACKALLGLIGALCGIAAGTLAGIGWMYWYLRKRDRQRADAFAAMTQSKAEPASSSAPEAEPKMLKDAGRHFRRGTMRR